MVLAASILGALVQVAAVSVLPGVLVWLFVRDRRDTPSRPGRSDRSTPVPSGADDRPTHRPLQLVAADLRTLAPAVRTPAPDTSPAQRAATVLAYDAALGEACAMLEVAEDLRGARRRGDAEVERHRVEAALAGVGLDVRR